MPRTQGGEAEPGQGRTLAEPSLHFPIDLFSSNTMEASTPAQVATVTAMELYTEGPNPHPGLTTYKADRAQD